MEKEILKEPNLQEELLAILRSPLSKEEMIDSLRDYHEKDIADALEELTPEERQKLYGDYSFGDALLDTTLDIISDIFSPKKKTKKK